MTYMIDAHQDIAYNAFTLHRDFRLSAHEIRQREIGTSFPALNNGEATLGWKDYQSGKIAVIFATLFLTPKSTMVGITRPRHTPRPAKLDSFSQAARLLPLSHRRRQVLPAHTKPVRPDPGSAALEIGPAWRSPGGIDSVA